MSNFKCNKSYCYNTFTIFQFLYPGIELKTFTLFKNDIFKYNIFFSDLNMALEFIAVLSSFVHFNREKEI